MYTINAWPILVAAVASFAIGALWYSPVLFGKEWMALMKFDAKDCSSENMKGIWKSYIIHFIANLITYIVLGFLVAATVASTSLDASFFAFVAWLGFVAPVGVSEILWSKKPFKLVLINVMCSLVCLLIGGAIIGGWN